MIGFRTISVVLLAFSAIGCGDNPRENDSTRDSESATGTPEAAANPRATPGKDPTVDVNKAEVEGACQTCVAINCTTLGIQVGAIRGKAQAKMGAAMLNIKIPAATELPKLSAELLTCVQTKCASECAADSK